MEDHNQPLLLHPATAADHVEERIVVLRGDDDIPPLGNFGDFCRVFYSELVKLWFLAGPAIFTLVCQYSLGTITQIFAGHIGTLELAAVSVENSVIAGFSVGTMLGMGSALETLCGQAYGAGQLDMLGVYLQRSCIILFATSALLSLIYIFATPLLLLIGQDPSIARAAGVFAIWMLPQLFAYAFKFPMSKFLQAQSKMMVMAGIGAGALALHALFSWLLVVKLGWGLAGAAVVLNASWWFINASQFAYIAGGSCGRAWSGFTWKAFRNLWSFVRLSLASAIMVCLEIWYFMALILFAGYLKDAEVSVAALSICVRISNELGAGRPRTAKFALLVAVISSFIVGLSLALVLIFTKDSYPSIFSNDPAVKLLVTELTPLMALCIVINNVQPVLSGVAIGAGWQAAVAYVNICCYYVFGIPLGLFLGYRLDMGVTGIWYGMLGGTVVQTLVLYWMIYTTNWNKEASMAGDRIKKWGGDDADSRTSH
ncbi:Protein DETOXIFICATION 29 [Linum grandiflorum]